MKPTVTYKLEIILVEKNLKLLLDVKEFLHFLGIHSYAEDSFDSLESLDNEICLEKLDDLMSHDYVSDSITLFAYHKDELEAQEKKILSQFNHKITTKLSSMKTSLWADAWKDSFKPIESKRFIIYPPWEEKKLASHPKTKIVIEPALAFGTGQHESTQLCLKLFENYLLELKEKTPQNVLDLGTGSGILAIAAAKEGVDSIDALDIDEDAVRAAKENAKLNRVTLKLEKSDLENFKRHHKDLKYDLVFANIVLLVLVKVVPEMLSIISSSGQIILSGLISSQKEEMLTVCQESGFSLVEEVSVNDWLGLRIKKELV